MAAWQHRISVSGINGGKRHRQPLASKASAISAAYSVAAWHHQRKRISGVSGGSIVMAA